MPAGDQDGRERLRRAVGNVEISGYIKSGQALENDLLDVVSVELDPTRDLDIQRSPMLRQAADLLLRRLRGDYTDYPQAVVLSTKMLLRDSVRKL